MDQLRVTALGSLRAQLGNHSLDLGGAKTRALLGYLATNPTVIQSRAHLAALLWPEASEPKARQSLRSTLYQLRRGLDEAWGAPLEADAKPSDRLLCIDHDRVSWHADAVVTCDVVEFGAAIARVEGHDHVDIVECGRCTAELQGAADLYTGHFLRDVDLPSAPAFHDWLELQRSALQNQSLRVLNQLCELHEQRGEIEQGRARSSQLAVLHRGGALAVATDEPEVTLPPDPTRISSTAPTSTAPSSIPFHRNAAFVGRDRELRELAKLLLPDSVSPTLQAAVVSGIGGIGKTQLAVEFVCEYGDQYHGGAHWINCADPDVLLGEVAWVGSEHGLGLYRLDDDLSLAEQVARVRHHWQTGPPQLLIFDSCEDVDIVLDWLPIQGQTSSLFTSRRGGWPPELPLVELPVRELSRSASVSYLVSIATHLSESDAALVAAAIGDHPLALHLTGQFMARLTGLDAAEYVAQMQGDPAGLHGSLQGVASRYSPTEHEQNIDRTFAMSYDRLSSSDPRDALARQALRRICQVGVGVPVERTVLGAESAGTSDGAKLVSTERGIERLVEVGLLTNDAGDAVTVHQLVADFVHRMADTDSLLAV